MTYSKLDVRAEELEAQPAVRRRPGSRRVAISAVGKAAEVIGSIEQGVEITGLTNGQFSLIDTLEHVLTEIGPADVLVSTWTMGIYDADRAEMFCKNGMIRSIRWLVDPSMFGRRPEIAGKLIQAFGVEAFRAVNNHAKFATLCNEEFQVCIRSSMNLNPNKRLENFDISEGAELAGMFNALADDVFRRFPAGAAGKTQSRRFFKDILATFESVQADLEVLPGVHALTMGELAAGLGID